MNAMRPLVTIVDDDESVRESLPDLLVECGFSVRAFSSAEEFLTSDCVGVAGCLILDMAMPGMSGLDLQCELSRSGRFIPIVFITASRDDVARDLVLSRGAVDCLYKPFSDSVLLAALQAAFH
jgi:FixJ family two-component response regulator